MRPVAPTKEPVGVGEDEELALEAQEHVSRAMRAMATSDGTLWVRERVRVSDD